jgi:transcriptional regulator with XRE-family HTH domain
LQFHEFRSGIGRRIRESRERKGLSQNELSELCRISDGYLSQIERGMKTPSLETFYAIATGLHVDPSILISTQDDERNRALRALVDVLSECPVEVILTAIAQGKELARLHRKLSAGSGS